MSEFIGDNRKAYELLEAAKTTSSKIKIKDKEGEEREIDDLYPLTMEEANEMDSLLNQASNAIQDHSDSEIVDQISYMKNIVSWSKEKHFNISRIQLISLLMPAVSAVFSVFKLANGLLISFLFVGVLVAYVFSCYQYGYVIKRNTIINNILNKISDFLTKIIVSPFRNDKQETNTSKTTVIVGTPEQVAGYGIMSLLWPILKIGFIFTIYTSLVLPIFFALFFVLAILNTIINIYHNIAWK